MNAPTFDPTRLEHMCQVCNRNTSGCHRVRLRRGGKFVASVHAECALGVSWTEEAIAEPVPAVETNDAEAEKLAETYASTDPLFRSLNAEEVQEFRRCAREQAIEAVAGLSKSIYHPIFRDELVKCILRIGGQSTP